MENELMMVEYLIIWMVFSCGMAVVSYFMWKNKRKEVRNLLEGSGEKVCMTLNGGGSTLDLPVCVLASLVMPGAYCFAWAFVGGMEGTLEDEELSMFSYALIFIAFLMLAVMVLCPYLQLIIPQYFISNKSGIWSLSLIVHSKG